MNLIKDCLTSLELFCGTKSFTKEARRIGIEKTTTLDNNPIFKPDILMDVMDYNSPGRHFTLLWASPPCQCFSLMSARYYWAKMNDKYIPKRPKVTKAVNLIRKTLDIIDKEQPAYWFIENPKGMLRLMFDDIAREVGFDGYSYKRETVTYCQYGESRMKPTDIWTNFFKWKPRPACNNGDSCHERVTPRNRKGTVGLPTAIHRSVVPKELCVEILEAIKKDLGDGFK